MTFIDHEGTIITALYRQFLKGALREALQIMDADFVLYEAQGHALDRITTCLNYPGLFIVFESGFKREIHMAYLVLSDYRGHEWVKISLEIDTKNELQSSDPDVNQLVARLYRRVKINTDRILRPLY